MIETSVEIIAEIAQGFEGDVTLARMLARGAARAGADAVKFQLVFADELAVPDYQYYELFRSLEMSEQEWASVAAEVRLGDARVYFDVYGPRSLALALGMGAEGLKIHATDFFNHELVASALASGKRVYVSFGGLTPDELSKFVERHGISPASDVCFLYGYQAEPTPLASNNLRRLSALQTRFPGLKFGFMDHAEGCTPEALLLSLLALPFGPACIEKHCGLDPALDLEDGVSALAPERFAEFVGMLRALEPALGSDDLALTDAETAYRGRALKNVIAVRDLVAGEVIAAGDLSLKRPATPADEPLFRLEDAVGQTVAEDIGRDRPVTRRSLA